MSKLFPKIYVILLIAAIVVSVVPVGVYYIYQEFFISSPKSSVIPIPAVETARNWAGYVAASDLQNPKPDVVGVSASWTVPTSQTSEPMRSRRFGLVEAENLIKHLSKLEQSKIG